MWEGKPIRAVIDIGRSIPQFSMGIPSKRKI
jgi:hypothetical protein